MAFSFDTFVEDQKQTAIDVVDTVTPSQIKQVAAAYKEGLNASPKQVINETLEKFTGIDLGQGVGLDGVGAQVKDFIKGQAAGLTMQLEQQILGCINTQIRDLMNKVPAIDFILNFEDKINGILGNFRNKLEFKIDAELRKLTYNKIKIHQVTLFKQRIRAQIKSICPGAAPASVAEVQDFNNKVKRFIRKRTNDNKIDDAETTLPSTEINTSGSGAARYVTRDEEQGPSNSFVREMKQKGKKEAFAKEQAGPVAAVVADEANSQLEEKEKKEEEGEGVPALLDTETTAELIGKRWLGIFVIDHSSQTRYKWSGVDGALLKIYMAMNKDIDADPEFTSSDWWIRHYSLAIHKADSATRLTLPETGGYISILYLRQDRDATEDSMTGQWHVPVIFKLVTRKFEDRSKWGFGAQSKDYKEWDAGEKLPSTEWEEFNGSGNTHMAATLDAIGRIKKEIERQEAEEFPAIIPSKKGKIQDWLIDE